MNTKNTKNIYELSLEEVRQAIAEYDAAKKEYIDAIQRVEREVYNSPAYQALVKEMKAQDREVSALERERDAMYARIRSRFLTGNDTHPRYSTTYGANIRPEVIEAIKKSFSWKMLASSTVEEIVARLIKTEFGNDAGIKSISQRINALHDSIDELSRQETKLLREAREKVTNNCPFDRTALERRLATLLVEQRDRKTMSQEVESRHVKKRALEEYRQSCIFNASDVLKNLNAGVQR